MARKSRKVNNKPELPNLKPSLIQTAAYVRLSLEDRAQKGSSIENQQHIILSFIEEQPDFELYDTYIDSGISGTTFERPSFQRMLRDAEAGKISCIIVKDLSRLGRNVIDTGYYAEKLFPSLGIRLISITDNYDTDDDHDNGARLPLINLVNEVYALDISRKTRAQARQAMKDGVYVGGQPPFGYLRSPADRHKLIIDTPAAETVRQIFMWAAEKISIYDITRRLNSSKVPSPNAYRANTRATYKTAPIGFGIWRVKTVERIIKNEIYQGHLIQGKSRAVNFNRQGTSPDEWIYTYNSHEAIVSAELFEDAQTDKNGISQAATLKKSRVSPSPNIFVGKIFCAHCGGALERVKNHDKHIYRCITKRVAPDLCNGNRISEDAVRQALIEQLFHHKESIIGDVRKPSTDSDSIPELRFIEMELSHFQDIIRGLYENLVNGVINESDYRDLKSNYERDITPLRKRADELKKQLSDEKRLKTILHEFLRVLNGLTDASMLTKEHVDRFVERIEIFRNGQVHVRLINIHTNESIKPTILLEEPF